jgi:hypothetical protein
MALAALKMISALGDFSALAVAPGGGEHADRRIAVIDKEIMDRSISIFSPFCCFALRVSASFCYAFWVGGLPECPAAISG